MNVAFEEGFLAAGGEHPVHGLAGVGQPQREQEDLGHLAREHHVDVAEVDLRLSSGQMGLRHEHRVRAHSGLLADLLATVLHIGTDHRVRDVVGLMPLDQAVEDPLGSVPLLGRSIQV
ncbi:hypothetical protein ACFRLW_31555, partial [Streptomyces sp. NPDC056728]